MKRDKVEHQKPGVNTQEIDIPKVGCDQYGLPHSITVYSHTT